MKRTFATWLRREIQERLLTLGEFAETAQIGERTLYSFLSGERLPSGLTAVRLARALNITREQLEEHMPQKVAC